MFGKVARPVRAYVTRWGDDQYIRGAYSYIPKGATMEQAKMLAQPCGRIYWAGTEHEAATHMQSTRMLSNSEQM